MGDHSLCIIVAPSVFCSEPSDWPLQFCYFPIYGLVVSLISLICGVPFKLHCTLHLSWDNSLLWSRSQNQICFCGVEAACVISVFLPDHAANMTILSEFDNRYGIREI